MGSRLRNARDREPRPICPECGEIVDPKYAAVLSRLKGDEHWISAADDLLGVYCCSEHLLNAYERGFPAALLEDDPDDAPDPYGF